MVKNQNLDEQLIDQMVNEFINESLNPLYELSYTEFEYSYNKFDFYLKAYDLLRPNLYFMKDSYHSNSFVFLRLNTTTLAAKVSEGKEALTAYLQAALKESKAYQTYIQRIK